MKQKSEWWMASPISLMWDEEGGGGGRLESTSTSTSDRSTADKKGTIAMYTSFCSG
jgi:hypothetical protein